MADLLPTAALFSLGLYAGSLLTEGAVLTPIWRDLPAADFFRMHKTVGPRLYRYYSPVTIAGVTAPIALIAVDALRGERPGAAALTCVALCLGALATYFLYFQSANRSFAERTIADEALAGELERWALVHWVRTAMIVAAFGLLLYIRL